MKFIDLHCDTLMKAYRNRIENIYEMPDCMLDIKRMKSGGALAQFFAIFLLPPGAWERFNRDKPIEDSEYIQYSLKVFENTMRQNSEIIAAAYNAADILQNEKDGKMSGLLTFEDGRAIDGKLENLKHYYDKGIRLISLTWNHENCFGAPNSKDPAIMSKGLTDFGKEAILEMNRLGMMIDVSHLSDGGFMDVVQISQKPFVASHSNCRSLSPHQRNLTDEMIKLLAQKGGVAGINFGPEFLNSDITLKDSTVDLMIAHIDRMVNLGGIGCVALGSDFDGIGGNLEVNSVDKMHLIFDKLTKRGYSESDIEKIAYQNALRVIREVL